jgi:His/Glu/Gln/Arg/opine family amino acid ABC transporter permease subunit
MEFDWAFFLDAMPRVGAGVLVNIRLALVIFAFAVIGGTVLTLIRSLKNRLANAVIGVLISFIRGTPLIIQIFLCFYALPALGIRLSPVTAGILAIALNSAVFITEIMRGGLAGMDPGPIEAGTALGLRPAHIWHRIVLPQLFRRTLPMLVNEATIVIKGTALLSVITVVEALRVAQQLGAANFRPFEPIVAAALFFVVINLVLVMLAALAERRFAEARA